MKAAQLKALLSKVSDDAEVVLFDGMNGWYLPSFTMLLAPDGTDNNENDVGRPVVYFDLDMTEEGCDNIDPYEGGKEIT